MSALTRFCAASSFGMLSQRMPPTLASTSDILPAPMAKVEASTLPCMKSSAPRTTCGTGTPSNSDGFTPNAAMAR